MLDSLTLTLTSRFNMIMSKIKELTLFQKFTNFPDFTSCTTSLLYFRYIKRVFSLQNHKNGLQENRSFLHFKFIRLDKTAIGYTNTSIKYQSIWT